MKNSTIQVICGSGKGKTSCAVGQGITALTKGQSVIMVQFLKGSLEQEGVEIIRRLEPEFKLFRFEKTPCPYDRLSKEEKQEAGVRIRNGLNFAKKVLVTGECSLLILDEILGIFQEGIISEEELRAFIDQGRQSETSMILTGEICPEFLEAQADRKTTIC